MKVLQMFPSELESVLRIVIYWSQDFTSRRHKTVGTRTMACLGSSVASNQRKGREDYKQLQEGDSENGIPHVLVSIRHSNGQS
jgi:hypothetical protein